ncbi:hypothetical protein MSG28_007730 [Choristoneura fumiferana]|uniref:Uncharacterized protein n=1 Tax=Choristoneura fumiferana TaxID=7141 RepID=A0ACC0JYM1_CHOFU|nr:hypothetical protein MSG28_007730 [Choristoneura fumiferana]
MSGGNVLCESASGADSARTQFNVQPLAAWKYFLHKVDRCKIKVFFHWRGETIIEICIVKEFSPSASPVEWKQHARLHQMHGSYEHGKKTDKIWLGLRQLSRGYIRATPRVATLPDSTGCEYTTVSCRRAHVVIILARSEPTRLFPYHLAHADRNRAVCVASARSATRGAVLIVSICVASERRSRSARGASSGYAAIGVKRGGIGKSDHERSLVRQYGVLKPTILEARYILLPGTSSDKEDDMENQAGEEWPPESSYQGPPAPGD